MKFKQKILVAFTIFSLVITIPLTAQTAYVDFGPTAPTNPSNGVYWNQWRPGNNIDLLDSTDGSTDLNWNLYSTSPSVQDNGGFVPSSTSAVSPFDTANVYSDALYVENVDGTRNLIINGLNPSLTYNFQIYGSRNIGSTRETFYSVIGNNTLTGNLTTSGTSIGTGGVNYNNDTLLDINGISPTAEGLVTVEYSAQAGQYGYINAMSITAIPEPSTFILFGLSGLAGIIAYRRRK